MPQHRRVLGRRRGEDRDRNHHAHGGHVHAVRPTPRQHEAQMSLLAHWGKGSEGTGIAFFLAQDVTGVSVRPSVWFVVQRGFIPLWKVERACKSLYI